VNCPLAGISGSAPLPTNVAGFGEQPDISGYTSPSTVNARVSNFTPQPASTASVPDYWKADPLLMHVAYVSDNPAADQDRLVEAGAVVADELMTTPSGDAIVMLRDPWGVPIQLVKRAKPML